MRTPMPSPNGTNRAGLFLPPTMAFDSACERGTLTPEQALQELRRQDEAVLQSAGSVPLDQDPRLSKYRSQMSPADFKALCRMVQDVRFGFRSSAQDRVRLSRLHAHDASAEASFKRLFPDASLPETIFY